jgi:hypothetical protein
MEPVYVLDENEQVYTKDFIVDKIRKHLREVEELKGSGNKSKKAAIVVEIFRFLSKYQVIRDFINVQKKFKETEQELLRLSNSDKTEPRYYAYLADFYIEQNKLDEAKLMYDKIKS